MGEFTQHDRDMLIRLDERTTSMHNCLKAHLAKHWKIELLAVASGLSFLGAIVMALIVR